MTYRRLSAKPGGVPTVVAILLLALGCGDDEFTAPTGRELVGSWGSADGRLVAVRSGADLRAGCVSFIIDGPIVLTDENTFSVRAGVYGPGASIGNLPVVRLSGSVAGRAVRVAVPVSDQAPAGTYVLEQGVDPVPPECPA